MGDEVGGLYVGGVSAGIGREERSGKVLWKAEEKRAKAEKSQMIWRLWVA